MRKFKNLAGQKFFRLTALRHEVRRDYYNRTTTYWLCECDCFSRKWIATSHLMSGKIRSCGCLAKELVSTRNRTHGMAAGEHSSIYRLWRGMIQRCSDQNSVGYENYGGRGITVCDRWRKFEYFYADMGDPPLGMTLDRIDNNKGYSKENCRWATKQEQANNRRNTFYISIDGLNKPLSIWCVEYNVSDQIEVIRRRIKGLKWDPVVALTTPVRSQK